jgi:hypothetical protein
MHGVRAGPQAVATGPTTGPCLPNSRTSCALGVQSAVSGFGRGLSRRASENIVRLLVHVGFEGPDHVPRSPRDRQSKCQPHQDLVRESERRAGEPRRPPPLAP